MQIIPLKSRPRMKHKKRGNTPPPKKKVRAGCWTENPFCLCCSRVTKTRCPWERLSAVTKQRLAVQCFLLKALYEQTSVHALGSILNCQHYGDSPWVAASTLELGTLKQTKVGAAQNPLFWRVFFFCKTVFTLSSFFEGEKKACLWTLPIPPPQLLLFHTHTFFQWMV